MRIRAAILNKKKTDKRPFQPIVFYFSPVYLKRAHDQQRRAYQFREHTISYRWLCFGGFNRARTQTSKHNAYGRPRIHARIAAIICRFVCTVRLPVCVDLLYAKPSRIIVCSIRENSSVFCAAKLKYTPRELKKKIHKFGVFCVCIAFDELGQSLNWTICLRIFAVGAAEQLVQVVWMR